MDKLDKMRGSLEKNLPKKVETKDLQDKKEIKDDYEFSRETYRDLIRTGTLSLDVLAELARESEHPRAFEVLSKTIKDLADTTEKLMALQKSKKDLNKEDKEKEERRNVTNNNVFIGSTTDLQRVLQQDKDKIIDGSATENKE
jgi:hypothetical protein